MSRWYFQAPSLLGGRKAAGAEPMLVAGYDGMKQREAKIPAAAKVRLTERLVQLYDAWNKPAEAAKWRKELAVRKEAEKKPPTKP